MNRIFFLITFHKLLFSNIFNINFKHHIFGGKHTVLLLFLRWGWLNIAWKTKIQFWTPFCRKKFLDDDCTKIFASPTIFGHRMSSSSYMTYLFTQIYKSCFNLMSFKGRKRIISFLHSFCFRPRVCPPSSQFLPSFHLPSPSLPPSSPPSQ